MRGGQKRGGGTTGQLEFSGVFMHSSLVCGFFRASSRCSDLSFLLLVVSPTLDILVHNVVWSGSIIVSSLPAFPFPSFTSTSHLRLVSPSSPLLPRLSLCPLNHSRPRCCQRASTWLCRILSSSFSHHGSVLVSLHHAFSSSSRRTYASHQLQV